MARLKVSKKILFTLIRVLVSVLLFLTAFNRASIWYFKQNPLLNIENFAEIIIAFVFSVVLYFFSPNIAKGVSSWFENLVFKVLKRVVSDFVKMQSDRIREAKIKRDVQKKESFEEELKLKRYGSPVIMDTSAIIDGRILEVIKLGFLDSILIVPDSVITELRHIADSEDKLKRQRGRRGFDILNDIKRVKGKNYKLINTNFKGEVDKGLIDLAKKYKGRLATVDFNLNKAAKVSGVKVINVNELVNSLKTVVLPGENILVKIIQRGKEENQGVGYLDDGTMVVVDGGWSMVGKGEVGVEVKRVIQTPAGKMVFCSPR